MSLYIQIKNGPNLDLNQKDTISINYNFNEVDFLLRKSNFSKTLSLPNTPNNNKFFKNYYRLDLDSSNAYDTNKQVQCILYDDDNVIIDGVLQLRSVDIINDEIVYQITVYDKIKRLYTDIGDSMLNTLDFSRYDHTRSFETITKSYDDICFDLDGNEKKYNMGSGYRYPHIFNQSFSDTSKITIQSQFPALFLKEYIDEIFSSNGYTYKSDFFNSPSFNQILLPYDKGELTLNSAEVIDYSVKLEYPIKNEVNQSLNYETLITQNGNGELSALLSFTKFVEGNDNGQYDLTSGQYPIEKDGEYSLTVLAKYLWRYQNTQRYKIRCNNTNALAKLKLFRIDTNGNETILAQNSQWALGTSNASVEISAGTYKNYANSMSLDRTLTLNAGDRLYIRIYLNRAEEYWFRPDHITNKKADKPARARLLIQDYGNGQGGNDSAYSKFVVELSPQDAEAVFDIRFADVIPNVTQKALLSDVIKFFNLRVIADNTNKVDFIIEPYDTIYGNTGSRTIKDWTNKVDRSKKLEILPNPIGWREYNIFYTESNTQDNMDYYETYGSSYGDVSVYIENDFNDEVKEYQTIFSPSIPSLAYSDRVMPYNIEVDTDGSFSVVDPGLTMFFWSKEASDCNTYQFFGTESDAIANVDGLSYSRYRKVTHLSQDAGSDWDLLLYNPKKYYTQVSPIKNDNVYNVFHSNYISQLLRPESRIIRAEINLRGVDISTVQANDLIFIDNDYYNILTIKNWDDKKPTCSVELFRNTTISDFIIESIDYKGGDICPSDIRTAKYYYGMVRYYSESGGNNLSADCCSSLGGSLRANGMCIASNYGATTPVRDYESVNHLGWTPVKWEPLNRPNYQFSRADYYRNTYNTPDIGIRSVFGRYNYVSNPYSIVLGNNNVLPDAIDTEDLRFVLGNNVTADQGSGLYFGDYFLNSETGTIEENTSTIILVWDGGQDLSYDTTKENEEDILNGGEDANFNQSDVDRDGPNVYGDV